MIELLITLLVLVLIAGLVWWAITQIPLPDPVRWVVIVVFVIVLCIILLRLIPGVNLG